MFDIDFSNSFRHGGLLETGHQVSLAKFHLVWNLFKIVVWTFNMKMYSYLNKDYLWNFYPGGLIGKGWYGVHFGNSEIVQYL